MFERQQLLLQQMGIPLWITRQHDVTQKNFDMLWRDQSGFDSPVENTEIVLPQITPEPIKPLAQPKIQPQAEIKQIADSAVQPQPEIKQLIEDVASPLSDLPVSQEIAFQYEILIHEKFLIFAHVDNEAQRRLLQNIQKACFAELTQLKWPLNIKSWNPCDEHVESYVQGFLTIHADKEMILLGRIELSVINGLDTKTHRLAALSDMLDSAEHKRSLWQIVYPHIE